MDPTRVLWAKKSTDQMLDEWLPLPVHMNDTAVTARLLWDQWLPQSTKNAILSGVLLNNELAGTDITEQLVFFLAYVHDVGKATPVFQIRKDFRSSNLDEVLRRGLEAAGFPMKEGYDCRKETRHGLVSHSILRRYGFNDSVAVVVGGHHGLPPNNEQLLKLEEGGYNSACGFDSNLWISTQDFLVSQALSFSGIDRETAISITFSRQAQVLLTGLIILADWIASDTVHMPLIPIEEYNADSYKRVQEALSTISLPNMWCPEWDIYELFKRRFNIDSLRPIQEALIKVLESCLKPGILVIEAPMGEGKTETALAAAELLANRKGCRGIYFALPSQATSDAMFTRVIDWIKHFEHFGEQYSARLIHGKADINEMQSALKLSNRVEVYDDDGSAQVVVHEWLSGRKKGILADFTIGTIDHVLMAALRQKHLVLRHLGLAGKVVIIDECHAYDVYMESYLLKALNWLGAYSVPVIVLSATLPEERRRAVIDAYLNKKPKQEIRSLSWSKTPVERASDKIDYQAIGTEKDTKPYPLITYTDGSDVRQLKVRGPVRETKVEFCRTVEDRLVDILKTSLIDGGCAGIIVNTVKRAQELFEQLRDVFGGNVCLLHGQFIARDRSRREKDLIRFLGLPVDNPERPSKLIVIGTQIFEQSLDIDFDVMISELCPIDLLLQRVGRLHRHKRRRPKQLVNAVCYVLDASWGEFNRASEFIYSKYLMMRSAAVLPDHAVLPGDIPRLVAEVYDENCDIALPKAMVGDFEESKKAWILDRDIRVRRSKAFQVSGPHARMPLLGWLDTSISDVSDTRSEAAVRDGSDSLEVIVVQQRGNDLYFLPWIESGQKLPRPTPANELARKISTCSVRLPAVFGGEWIIDKAISKLEAKMTDEKLNISWYKSHWLKGTLCLILDEAQEASLCGYRLRYDEELGLCTKKEEG